MYELKCESFYVFGQKIVGDFKIWVQIFILPTMIKFSKPLKLLIFMFAAVIFMLILTNVKEVFIWIQCLCE